jgi:hypothetical protein
MGCDVFISYNSQDHVVVGEIAKRLHERGLTAFLDRWYLPKGQPWRSLLGENIASSGAVAVFVGQQGMGPWQHREIDVALDRQARQVGFPVIPVLLPGSEPPLGFLRQNTWIDQRNQPLEQVVFQLEKAIRGESPGPDSAVQFAAAKNSVPPIAACITSGRRTRPFSLAAQPRSPGCTRPWKSRHSSPSWARRAVVSRPWRAPVSCRGCARIATRSGRWPPWFLAMNR